MTPKHKHEWVWIGETRQSENEWCETCGAWKRLDLDTGKTTITHPKAKKLRRPSENLYQKW